MVAEDVLDLVIVGAGPAGMSAAIYATRYGMKFVVLEAKSPGGLAALASDIENYPGFKRITGMELMDKFQDHAKSLGADIHIVENVQGIEKIDNLYKVVTDSKEYIARSLILAMGGEHRVLNIPGEKEFLGKGVSYCATCDGFFFKNKTVIVIGGGDAALMGADYLNNIAAKTYIAYRRKAFFRPEKVRIDALNKSNVEQLLGWTPVEIKGNEKVTSIVLKNVDTGELKEIPVDGVFIEIGTTPASAIAKDIGVNTDDHGYILTDCHTMETNIPGVFAAGDITGGLMQIVTAAGEGATAAYNAFLYVSRTKNQ